MNQVVEGKESAPITVAFENRITPQLFIPAEAEHTWLLVVPDVDWRRQFGVFGAQFDHDLGAKLIDTYLESEPMDFKFVINDNRLALKTRIDFPYGAKFLTKNFSELIESIKGCLIGNLVELGLGDSDATIKTLSAEIMFTLRDQSVLDDFGQAWAGPSTCDILIRPFIELDGISQTITTTLSALLEGLCARAYDQGSPIFAYLDKLRKTAELIWRATCHYVLGRDQPELINQVLVPDGIRLRYAGDKEQGPVATTGDGPATSGQPLSDPGLLANIQHIVVLMMENRSFDQMLGYLSLPTVLHGRGRADVDGLRGDEWNTTVEGGRAYVFPFAREPATLFGYDPGHDVHDMKLQRGGQTLDFPVTESPRVPGLGEGESSDVRHVHVPNMGGFVLAYGARLPEMYSAAQLADTSRNYGSVASDIMGYHLPSSVPTYDFLAANYMVCDRWFSAHPGDTWPNRFVTLTGGLAPRPPHDPHPGFPQIETPQGIDFTPISTKNIFDYLTAAGVSWRYYEHDMCMLRLFADYTLGHPNIVQIDDTVQGLEAAAGAGTLPSVVFIDPDLTDIPAGNDDHPPTDITYGQELVNRVYRALSPPNGKDWATTLLIITYDECGGFFDHVLPRDVSNPNDPNYVSSMFSDPQFPEQAAPGQFNPQPVHYRGARVPALIVTPYVRPGSVSHIVFDHTSILKTITTRFLHDNPPPLGERVDRAHGLHEVLVPPDLRPTVVVGTPPALAMARRRDTPIANDHFPGDFRTFMSAVRDRYFLGALRWKERQCVKPTFPFLPPEKPQSSRRRAVWPSLLSRNVEQRIQRKPRGVVVVPLTSATGASGYQPGFESFN